MSNKNKGGVGLFQISQKERLFHLLWQPSALADNLTVWSPSWTLQKRPFFPFSLAWKRIYLDTQLKEEFTDLFWKFQGNRNRMINTFMKVTSPPYVRDSLEDKVCLSTSKNPPLSHFTWALIWKKSWLICFQSYQGIPYSHTGRVDRVWWTLCSNGYH